MFLVEAMLVPSNNHSNYRYTEGTPASDNRKSGNNLPEEAKTEL